VVERQDGSSGLRDAETKEEKGQRKSATKPKKSERKIGSFSNVKTGARRFDVGGERGKINDEQQSYTEKKKRPTSPLRQNK